MNNKLILFVNNIKFFPLLRLCYGCRYVLNIRREGKNRSKSRAIAITNKYTKYKTINDRHRLHHDTHANHLVQHHYAN